MCPVTKLANNSEIGTTANLRFTRYPGNPIIAPRPEMLWEQRGTFNPAAIELDGITHILYRAVSADNISTIGYANSFDGLSIAERADKPIYFPRADFESKGCEDPRLTIIGSTIYMNYTAYDGIIPRIAVSSITVDDFRNKRWGSWTKPQIITPNSANKDSAILPETVNGKYLIFHRTNGSVCAEYFDSLNFSEVQIHGSTEIIVPRKNLWDEQKVGLSTPPIKTPSGWLLLYHGVSADMIYRLGAVLLDLNDPTTVISRTSEPIFEPEETYEKQGIVPNVIFPCGSVLRGKTLFIYYGGADYVVGVATMTLTNLLATLKV